MIHLTSDTSYLGDVFYEKGDKSALCKDMEDNSDNAVGTIIELFSICKEVNFRRFKVSSSLTLCH